MNAPDVFEMSVIGAVFLRPENLVLLPSLEPADFSLYKAKATFAAILNLQAQGKPIDVATVGGELERMGKLDAVGYDWLGECSLTVPTTDNAIAYAHQVKDSALKRRLIESLAEVLDAGKTGATGAEMLSLAMAATSGLDAEQPEQTITVGDLIKRRVKQLEEIARDRFEGRRTMTGYPTGVEKLDEKLGGWQTGIVSIVAARPAMGKSSLGLATADACSKAGFGVHLFSLEDTEDAYADRVLSRTSQVPAEDLRNANLTNASVEKVSLALMSITRRKGWIIDSRSGVTADEIVRSVRRKKRENETCVVIVDYVQLVKKARGMSSHEALTEIVTTFADAAKQDGLAYVVMSQLNRDLEKRDDKRPQLADLRESGSLEERAKCVVGVYRSAVYYTKPKKGIDYQEGQTPPTEEELQSQVQLLVLKNSNGRIGTVRAKWTGPTTRIE